jgi:hypothetical protein
MDEHHHDTLITALIETIAGWTHADKDRLASMLGRHCYPGGPVDRRDPSGIEPLRRSRAGGGTPALLACSCPHGRCRICNRAAGAGCVKRVTMRLRAPAGRAFDC